MYSKQGLEMENMSFVLAKPFLHFSDEIFALNYVNCHLLKTKQKCLFLWLPYSLAKQFYYCRLLNVHICRWNGTMYGTNYSHKLVSELFLCVQVVYLISSSFSSNNGFLGCDFKKPLLLNCSVDTAWHNMSQRNISTWRT